MLSKVGQIKAAILSMDGIGSKTWAKIKCKMNILDLSWAEAWSLLGENYSILGLNEAQGRAAITFSKKWQPADYDEYLQEKNIQVLLIDDEQIAAYPLLLREIVDRPDILFVKGNTQDLGEMKIPVAIVGTRRITSYGRFVTSKISRELVDCKATIVSGFMYGVDVLAQQEALAAGGKTIGVLGYGFDHCFPRNHAILMKEMIAAGQTFMTEFPPWTVARPGNFPRRNRIVAGMSWATVVTEAAVGSGSLITANLALDYGRSVMAIPGPITNPYCEGTKNLIKAGATLVTSGREIIAELCGELGGDVHERNLNAGRQSCACLADLEGDQLIIGKILAERSIGLSIEELGEESSLLPEKVKSAILMMNLAEIVRIEGELVLLS